jgi:hypothetical protein
VPDYLNHLENALFVHLHLLTDVQGTALNSQLDLLFDYAQELIEEIGVALA